jgi:hypothetical protein
MGKLDFALLVFSLGTVAPLVRGAAVNTITMTPMGTNTVFAIAGTFPSDFPTTPYSTPNASYALTFAVSTSPTSFAFGVGLGEMK